MAKTKTANKAFLTSTHQFYFTGNGLVFSLNVNFRHAIIFREHNAQKASLNLRNWVHVKLMGAKPVALSINHDPTEPDVY